VRTTRFPSHARWPSGFSLLRLQPADFDGPPQSLITPLFLLRVPASVIPFLLPPRLSFLNIFWTLEALSDAIPPRYQMIFHVLVPV